MRKIIFEICAFAVVICICFSTPMEAKAAESVDPKQASSLTLQYKQGDHSYEGLEIRIYRVAEVLEDFTFDLTSYFASYPVNIYGITSQGEWDAVENTLAAYAVSDSVPATAVQITDAGGKVQFDHLVPGMYLTLAVTANEESHTAYFENFLTVIPYPQEDASLLYDVIAYPKCELEFPAPVPEETPYLVKKCWRDYGSQKLRLDQVTVDIFKDGQLQETQILSAANNWTYEWSATSDDGVWTVIERLDPSTGYTVTTEQDGNIFTLTNTCDGEDDSPKTGDMDNYMPYILVMSFGGCVLILLSLLLRRREA